MSVAEGVAHKVMDVSNARRLLDNTAVMAVNQQTVRHVQLKLQAVTPISDTARLNKLRKRLGIDMSGVS